jgi:hypothetical protein
MQHDDQARREAFRRHVGLPDAPNARLDEYTPYVSKEEFERDVFLAGGLLDCMQQVDGGAFSPGRVEPNSFAEREARAAAARLLRAGSWQNCGEAIRPELRGFYNNLASLLDPRAPDPQFELALRRYGGKNGRVPSHALHSFVAHYLASRVKSDECDKATVYDATKQFAISARTVRDIWKREGRHIRNTWNVRKESTTPKDGTCTAE